MYSSFDNQAPALSIVKAKLHSIIVVVKHFTLFTLCFPENRSCSLNSPRMAQTPLIMRLVALSINSSKKAGEIIRGVMSSKQLNIIEKVGNLPLLSTWP